MTSPLESIDDLFNRNMRERGFNPDGTPLIPLPEWRTPPPLRSSWESSWTPEQFNRSISASQSRPAAPMWVQQGPVALPIPREWQGCRGMFCGFFDVQHVVLDFRKKIKIFSSKTIKNWLSYEFPKSGGQGGSVPRVLFWPVALTRDLCDISCDSLPPRPGKFIA